MSARTPDASNLLDWMYRDEDAEELFSMSNTFRTWTKVEIALSQAHFECGIISADELAEIRKLGSVEFPDMRSFRGAIRNVGYPIIELLNYLNGQLPEATKGVLHLGATTQDIMDTALSLQVASVGKLLLNHVAHLGDALAKLVEEHSATLMAGRTHAQQAGVIAPRQRQFLHLCGRHAFPLLG